MDDTFRKENATEIKISVGGYDSDLLMWGYKNAPEFLKSFASPDFTKDWVALVKKEFNEKFFSKSFLTNDFIESIELKDYVLLFGSKKK